MTYKSTFFLIFIAIVILFRYTQELDKFRRELEKNQVHFSFQILEKIHGEKTSCKISYNFYQLQLQNCSKYIIGDRISIDSKVMRLSDKVTDHQIRLTDRDIKEIRQDGDSGKYSILRLFGQISTRVQTVRDQTSRHLPALNGSLAFGMVFGGSASFPPDFTKKLQLVGMQHVVSASGYNAALVFETVVAFFSFVKFLRKRYVFPISLSILVLYVTISGFSAPLLRASLMLSLVIIGRKLFSRQIHTEFLLMISAAILLYYKPFLIHELSFQLSFAATLGLIKVMPIFSQLIERFSTQQQARVLAKKSTVPNSLIYQLRDYFFLAFAVTFSTQVFTVPVILFHFQQVSVLGLLVNPLLIWLVPTITATSAIFLSSMAIFPALGSFFAFPVWLNTELFIQGVQLLGRVPEKLVVFHFAPDGWQMISVWLFLHIGLSYFLRLMKKRSDEG